MMVHFTRSFSPEFLHIRTRLRALRILIGAKADEIHVANPAWDLGRDARLTSFAKLANNVESSELALKFLDEYLADSNWWRANYSPMPSGEDMKIYIVEFSQFAKTALLQLGFGAIESSLRVFLRTLDPDACNGSTAEFQSVYEHLLRSVLPELKNWIPALNLLRLLRNTIHNHGVHLHPKGKDAVVTYKGREYDFEHGSSVDFATWDLLIDLFTDMTEMLAAIVQSPEIQSRVGVVDPA